MKLTQALNYACEIHKRLTFVGGVIQTPNCRHPTVKINAVWVFGSTVKGSQAPNDLDLLIDLVPLGEPRKWSEIGVYDKSYFHSYGIKAAKESRHDALIWISKGMRHVSRHCTNTEFCEIDVKKMIFPDWCMSEKYQN